MTVVKNPTPAAIGDLVYLSGDIGKNKKREDKKKKKKEEKAKKKAEKKSNPKHTPRVLKKVAKVGLLPARGAYLTIVTLNTANMATKLARTWNNGGKQKVIDTWVGKFQGDIEKLKEAIRKGSKLQVSGIGSVAVAATVAATAIPIVVAMRPLFQQFKAEGDETEKKGLAAFIANGIKTLGKSPDFEKGNVQMPDGEPVADLQAGDDGEGMSTGTMIALAAAGAGVIYVATK